MNRQGEASSQGEASAERNREADNLSLQNELGVARQLPLSDDAVSTTWNIQLGEHSEPKSASLASGSGHLRGDHAAASIISSEATVGFDSGSVKEVEPSGHTSFSISHTELGLYSHGPSLIVNNDMVTAEHDITAAPMGFQRIPGPLPPAGNAGQTSSSSIGEACKDSISGTSRDKANRQELLRLLEATREEEEGEDDRKLNDSLQPMPLILDIGQGLQDLSMDAAVSRQGLGLGLGPSEGMPQGQRVPPVLMTPRRSPFKMSLVQTANEMSPPPALRDSPEPHQGEQNLQPTPPALANTSREKTDNEQSPPPGFSSYGYGSGEPPALLLHIPASLQMASPTRSLTNGASLTDKSETHISEVHAGPGTGAVRPTGTQGKCAQARSNAIILVPSPSPYPAPFISPSLPLLAPKPGPVLYAPLPRLPQRKSPKKQQLQKRVQSILPKGYSYELKAMSPTKAAARTLKRKATLFCQRSPTKPLLPKDPHAPQVSTVE